MADLRAVGLELALDVERVERVFDHLRLDALVVHADRGVVGVDRHAVAQLEVVGDAVGVTELCLEHVAAADDVVHAAEQRALDLAERRGELVVDHQPEVEARRLLDLRLEHRLARALARHELGVHLLHQRIAQQHLQLLLEVADLQRRPGVQGDAVGEVVLLEVDQPLDLGLREAALDDAVLDHALGDLLVGDHRARVDVARLDVVACEALAQLLEVDVAQLAVLEGRRDRLELGVREHRVAGDADLAHEHADHAAQAVGLRRARGWQLDLAGRRLAEFGARQRLLRGQHARGQGGRLRARDERSERERDAERACAATHGPTTRP